MIAYHDEVWGVPERDDHKLFTKLMLDMFQAGLSWRTILHKQDNFLRAFAGFDIDLLSRWGAREKRRLMNDAGIVRNRMKIEACLNNARLARELRDEGESLSRILWSFTGGKTLRDPRGMTRERIPARTPQAEAMAKELKRRGFRFLGPTICYAFMQAVGMVDDHTEECFRYVARR